MNNYLHTINCITHALYVLGVPYEINPMPAQNGYQLTFCWTDGDVACNELTQGSEHNLVETMDFPWDNGDVTVMTPQEAAARIACYFFEGGWADQMIWGE